jgi:hypothetical protein
MTAELPSAARQEGDHMKTWVTRLLPMMAVVGAATIVPCVAQAYNLRTPQIAFSSASLQGYFAGLPQAINTTTDQVDVQVFTTSVSGNAAFTLMAEFTGNAALNEVGVYNANDPSATPTLFPLLPPSAGAGWYVTVHFGSGNLVATLFDNTATFQSSVTYTGVNQSAFGFYIKGPGGTFYSQDSRNGSNAQVLTYAGTGSSLGTLWECFEESAYNSGTSDFDDAILNLQSVVTTPTRSDSWGHVKAGYR